MNSSFLSRAAAVIDWIADLIRGYIGYVYGAIILGVILMLLLYWLVEALQLNPFGRFAYYARRPGKELMHNVRSSRFYIPLRRALGFDPAVLMLLIALAIVCYVVAQIIGDVIILMNGLGAVMRAIDNGRMLAAGRYLIGFVLLGIVFYLLTLMTIVFVNWLFGLLVRPAYWALKRIEPLLRLFEFGGVFAGWSFLILYIALTFAAQAIAAIFLF